MATAILGWVLTVVGVLFIFLGLVAASRQVRVTTAACPSQASRESCRMRLFFSTLGQATSLVGTYSDRNRTCHGRTNARTWLAGGHSRLENSRATANRPRDYPDAISRRP